MREIKFRAWDNLEQKMFTYMEIVKGKMYSTTKAQLANYENFNRYTIMQYTNLKDKNEKEIFEGDILRFQYYVTHLKHPPISSLPLKETDPIMVKDYTEKIDYKKEVKIPDIYKEIENENFDGDFSKTYKVIGNIYQNPELLKEANNA